MLRESAVVISYENGIAKVKYQSQSACGQCVAKNSCGTSSLSELNGKRGEHIFNVESLIPLREGQVVEIGLEEKSMLLSALLMYIAPLLTLLMATLFSPYLSGSELIRTIIIFACTAISFFAVKRYTKKFSSQEEFQPVLLRVLK